VLRIHPRYRRHAYNPRPVPRLYEDPPPPLHPREGAPAGPIALLWLLSFLVGRDPLPLSLATMFFGALGVWPLYLWRPN